MDTKDEHLELLDLALGELSPEAEAELRLRVAESPELKAELEALEEGLAIAARVPVEEPPASMDEVILQAARRQVERAPSPEPAGSWARLVAFLRDAINGPQAAMATITVLVVAVGLWFIPTARREAEEQEAMRISDASHPPPEEGEPLLEPAAPEPDPAQTATGGVLKIELEDAERAEPRPTEERRATRERSATKSSGAAPEPLAAPSAPAMKRAARSSDEARSAPAASRAAAADSAADGFSATGAEATKLEATRERSARGGAAPAPSLAPVESEAMNEPSPEASDVAPSRVTEVERLFRGGSYAAAASLAREIVARPSPIEARSLATVYHVAARSERALGRHAAAVPLYRKLLADHPRYPRRAAAEAELADSLARLTR